MNNVLIKVLYGPYEANGVIKHKIQRVYGLTRYLQQNNYLVEVHPSPCLNRLTIKMDDRVIYTCDIRYLEFNILAQEDILCQRIIDVIQQHHELFSQPSNVPEFQSVSEGMRYQTKQKLVGFEDAHSVDFMSPTSASQYLFAAADDEEEEYTRSVFNALKQWNTHIFTYDYGCYMQEPLESDSTKIEEKKLSDETLIDSTTSSCACLSLDPPSLYSICYGPPTPFNTEVSQNKSDKLEQIEEIKELPRDFENDLNEEQEHAYNSSDSKNIFNDPLNQSDESLKRFDDIMDEFDELEEADDEIVTYAQYVQEKIEKQQSKQSKEFRTSFLNIQEEEYIHDQSSSLFDQNVSSISQALDSLKMELHHSSLNKEIKIESKTNSDNVDKVDTIEEVCKKRKTENVRYQICGAYTGGKCVKYAKK